MNAWWMALWLSAAALTSSEQLKVGETYVMRGKAQKGLPMLQKALQDPALSDALRARGEAATGLGLVQLERPAEAVPHLERALSLDATQEKTWLLLGMAHDLAGDVEKSLAAYADAARALPTSFAVRHERGMTLLEAGQLPEAAAWLDEAVARSPQHPELLADQAYARLLLGRYAEAREALLLAVAAAPKNADAFYLLGDAEAAQERSDEARAAYQRALEISPTHVQALFHLGLLELNTRRPAEAAAAFERLRKIEPDHARARALLGVALAQLGRDAEAKPLLIEAVAADPRFAQGLAHLGELSERAQALDEAIAYYERVAELKPSDDAVRARLSALRSARSKKP